MAVEINENERARRLLCEADEILSAPLDRAAMLQRIARLVTSRLADSCVIYGVDEDGTLHRLESASRDPWVAALLRPLASYEPPRIDSADNALTRALRDQIPQRVEQLTDADLQAQAKNDEHLSLLRAIQPSTHLIVPLVARGRIVGGITLSHVRTPCRHDPADCGLAQALARRMAPVLDNARLQDTVRRQALRLAALERDLIAYRRSRETLQRDWRRQQRALLEAQSARDAAERAVARNSRVLALPLALADAITPAQIAEAALTHCMAVFEADWGMIFLSSADARGLELIRAAGVPDHCLASYRYLSLDAPHPLTHAVHTRQPFLLPMDDTRNPRPLGAAPESCMFLYQVNASVPLLIKDHALGVLGLGFARGTRPSGEDRELMAALACQCALALERARLYRKCREANRLKDEFLATVSHELRTPLNTMTGWIHLLRNRDIDRAEAQRGLQVIERSAKAQSQIINDLLDVSRIITGQLQITVRPLSLAPIIRAAIHIVRPAARAKRIRLRAELDTRDDRILGDAPRLQQVIWNLLSNAVKFTPREGEILVTSIRQGACMEIRVRDTGQGIPPQILPHIFHRFLQEDGSTTREHGGLGLGLAIVQHLVELHGGTVHAESPGKGLGASFIVRLPATDRPATDLP